jgi:stage II sporulation protein D
MLEGTYAEIDSSCRRFRQPTFEGRYPGDLLVERGDGKTLRVIVTVPFDEYLEGIAEVPPTWPAAALEAQAIAARSYALARIGFTGPDGAAIETPICATTDCQVYGGIPLEPTPGIRRWYAAVRRTDGRSLVFDGRPADAVYFSTSNGRTYGNDEVFGSAPLPYLRGVVERDDGASPTSRWRVEIPHDDLAEFLTAGGYWSGGRIARVARRGGVVEIRGAGSTERIDETEFRGAVNAAAPCLIPGRYPTDSRYGSSLPLTIPSRWYTASPSRRSVVLTGRGWGHGAGMVQWGAYGKARKGWTTAQILAAYYGGLRPRAFPEPGLIRVLVADGLTSLMATPDGAGASFGDEPLDDRVVKIEPGGNGVRVRTPRLR